jgi:hypothetical protein
MQFFRQIERLARFYSFLDISDLCMKTTRIRCLWCILAIFFAACTKEATRTLSIDIEIREPVVTTLPAGSKQLDFTVVVTQLGNSFDRNFNFTLQRFADETVVDSFSTSLPTAKEFVRFSVTAPGPGDYWAYARVGGNEGYALSGTLVKVP